MERLIFQELGNFKRHDLHYEKSINDYDCYLFFYFNYTFHFFHTINVLLKSFSTLLDYSN